MHVDDVLELGRHREVRLSDLRLAEGVGWGEVDDSIALVAAHVLVRVPSPDRLRDAIAALARSTTLDELHAILPGVDAADLVERLASAGVVAGADAPAGVDASQATPALDVRVPTDRRLRVALLGGAHGAPEAIAAAARSVGVEVVAPDAADVRIVASDQPATVARESAHAWRAGRPHLPLDAFDGRIVVAGPLVLPPHTACFDCLALRRGGTTEWPDRHWELAHAGALRRPWRADDLEIAMRLACRTARSAFVDGIDGALGHATVWSPTAMTMRTSRIWKVPRCPTCSVIDSFSTSYPWSTPPTAPAG